MFSRVSHLILIIFALVGQSAAAQFGFNASMFFKTQGPKAPSGLTAAATLNQINLSWTDNSTDEIGFKIERSPDGTTAWTTITTTAANVVSYADGSVSSFGTPYFYRVSAVTGAGSSGYSGIASATSLVPTVTGFAATSGSSIGLSWNNMSVTSYVLVRGPAGSNPSFTPSDGTAYNTGTQGADLVVYVGPATSYSDSNVAVGSTHYYKIYAMAGSYKYSASVSASAVAIPICGAVGNDCYSSTTATTAGIATTPSGKMLQYVFANGTSGFKVWKDQNSNRILRANGLDQWASSLNIDGKGLSGNDLVEPNLGTAATSIQGRTCPPNVYISDTDKFSTGNCLYYSPLIAAQALNAAGTSQTVNGQIGLGLWTSPAYNYGATVGTARWYTGNIQTCTNKGMRLPAIFETVHVKDPNGTLFPNADGTPIWAYTTSSGVPGDSSAPTSVWWTATGAKGASNSYLTYNCTNYCTTASVTSYNLYSTTSRSTRCVLP